MKNSLTPQEKSIGGKMDKWNLLKRKRLLCERLYEEVEKISYGMGEVVSNNISEKESRLYRKNSQN